MLSDKQSVHVASAQVHSQGGAKEAIAPPNSESCAKNFKGFDV